MFERPKGDLFLTAEERRTKLLDVVNEHNFYAMKRDCQTCDYYKSIGGLSPFATEICDAYPERDIKKKHRQFCDDWKDDWWQDYMYEILLEIEEGHVHEQI